MESDIKYFIQILIGEIALGNNWKNNNNASGNN